MDPIVGQIQIFGSTSPVQGKTFDEIILRVRKDSGDAHLDYLHVTMTNTF